MPDVIRQINVEAVHSAQPVRTRRAAQPPSPSKKMPGLVLTATSTGLSAAQDEAPKGVTVRPAWEWLLDGREGVV